MKNYWYSLRFRYTLSVITLIFLIFSGAYLAYNTISQAQQETATRLKHHQQFIDKARQVRISVLESYTYIDAYLLEPAYKEYKTRALNSLDTAITLSEQIKKSRISELNNDVSLLMRLNQSLVQLRTETDKLFMSREDIALQYPSMSVGNNIMQPNRNSFNNAIAVALNELREEGKQKSKPEIYSEFIQARHLWTQVLSNFRLYLANRMGSFNESSLPIQETAIETMYLELRAQLQKLSALDELGELGFQASVAVEDMLTTGDNWFEGFKQVRQIHNAEGWRTDSRIMKQKIVPLINHISDLLFDVDNQVNTATARDMNILVDAAYRQTNILLWGAGAVLLFLLIIYMSTNHLVFRPIASVVRALKAEAIGKDGVMLPMVRSEETVALVDAFNEMAKRVHKRQSDLEHQALHDALTALPNRTLLQERMAHQIQVARREHSNITLFMIDLDRFKEINDTLGHHVGDKVLIEVGFRISTNLREIDTVARLGGDEFAVILPDTDTSQAENVAGKLLESMKQPFQIDELQLYLGMSIGISSYPEHGVDVATIIQHADVAMYVAKQNQSGYAIYDASKDEYSIRRLELINDLRNAIENNSLDLQFQPIINMLNDEVRGVETLLRWKHDSFGMIPPDQIINLAEQTALINPLTYWVFENALKQMEILHARGFEIEVSVNISVYNLRDSEFIDKIREIISGYKIEASKIVLEITESAMMSNPVHAAEVLSELDKMGLRLAVDDFGTGFSSLAYLKQLPVDELKIDKSFVIGMQNSNSDEVIVHSTIELAHNLGIEVVAEGVENKLNYNKLKGYLCDAAQGYYMSKPMPLDKLQVWLENFSLSNTL
ncbi:MAG: EAL domain-containing protein [Thioalkalispiraceae bacterium]